ncbi:Hypothetical predicted protein [Mytilus galloprovincialis]|uniref:Uncharacterized protein n=1 Tax=Mytilus galloprovincialis TaxID=29158 RepID=A0A8B6FC97_MYTGA|nr:Hypothetical predicted protein [Mytilus galloprovincialis]
MLHSEIDYTIKATIDQYKQEINTLTNENQKLRDDLDSLEQYGRRDLMGINGIPDGGNTETSDKTTELVTSLIKSIDRKLQPGDIIRSHRIGSASLTINSSENENHVQSKTPRQIIVRLKDPQLLLIMGGIETNPGPHPLSDDNDDHNNSFESVSESNSIREMFSTSISFLHLNVQSLLPKLDLIAEYEDFVILSFSETWLNGINSSDSVELLNYQKPFRKDRGLMKSGGGVIVYVKENIHSKRRDDLEVPGVEVIWIQLKINNKKCIEWNLLRAT